MLAGSANTTTPTSSNNPKDPIEEIAQALEKLLKVKETQKSSDPAKKPIEEIAQALANLIKDNKAPEKGVDNKIDTNMAKKAPEENSKTTPRDNKVTEDNRGEKKPEPQQTPTSPRGQTSYVKRLEEERQNNSNRNSNSGRG